MRLLLNGRDDLDTTPLSALYGRNLIDLKSYAAGRRYAALNEVIRRAWGLQEGSVADLYRRMVAGTVGDIGTVLPGGGGIVGSAEAARCELALLNARLWLPGEDGARYFAVRALVVLFLGRGKTVAGCRLPARMAPWRHAVRRARR